MMFGPPDNESPHSDAVDALEDQALHQRRTAPEIRRRDRAAGRLSSGSRFPDPELRLRTTATGHWRLRRDRLGRVPAVLQRQRPVQPRADGARAPRRTTTAPGCARRPLAHAAKQRGHAAAGVARSERDDRTELPLWEVFVRSRNGLAHKHVGSLHAADAEMALQDARDVYTRRGEGVSIWVVPSRRSPPPTRPTRTTLFEPAASKDLPPPDLLRDARRSRAHVSGACHRPSTPLYATCCAWPTTRWCSAIGCRNGAAMRRCSRRTSRSPISRST